MFMPGLEFDRIVSDWYYSPWSQEKYNWYLFARSVDPTGIVGGYFDYLQARHDDENYLKRYGLDYSDIKDPTKLRSTGSFVNLSRSSVNYVSRNIDRLYR